MSTRLLVRDRAAARRALKRLSPDELRAARSQAALDRDIATFDEAGEILRANKGTAEPRDEPLARKDFVATTQAGEVDTKASREARVIRFVVTTDDMDRDRDIVLPTGVDVAEYMRNPVFLWAHKFDLPPIGKTIRMGLTEGGRSLWADVQFAEDETSDRIFKLYLGGYLNAVSIGFKILRQGPPDSSIYSSRPMTARECQRVIYASKLLEVSAVPIPSNPEALRVAEQKGIITSQFAKERLMPETPPTETPARRVVGWISKQLGWSHDQIEALTLKQVEDLGIFLKPDTDEPTDEPQDDSKASKSRRVFPGTQTVDPTASQSPTQTATGDQVCPKCNKKCIECGCGKKSEDATEPAAVQEATTEQKGHCQKCGKSDTECKCGAVTKEPETPSTEPDAPKAASLDNQASIDQIADNVIKTLLNPAVTSSIIATISEGVTRAFQEQLDRARGKA